MDEILKKLLNAISDAYDKTQGYIIYDLLKAVAIVLTEYDIKLGDVTNLFDVDKLTGPMLDMYVSQRKGITRNPAKKAIGQLTVSGNGTITEGDIFETASGVQFVATETKMISGTGIVNIQALVSGSSGNVPANQITQMPVTIPGITAVTNPESTHDGYDEEPDDSLRERYYIAVRIPPTSGNVYHYFQWAKEVVGVGGVKVFPLERGDNTVEVVITDANMQPASQTLVNAVQEYIDPNSEGLGNGQAPIGCHCYVISANALPINISVTVTKDSEYTDDQVKNNININITNYLKSTAFNKSVISYSAISNAIFDSEGVLDHNNLTINNGVSNISIGDKQVPVLGSVNIAFA